MRELCMCNTKMLAYSFFTSSNNLESLESFLRGKILSTQRSCSSRFILSFLLLFDLVVQFRLHGLLFLLLGWM